MKNIHLLPTDKPSRLRIGNNGNFVLGLLQSATASKNDDFTNQHIYITSDEEITGFENNIWVIKGERIFLWQNMMALVSNNKPKKIILTTDEDLIKDGVQAIPDEFLEWFVKNPSCEEVEVSYEVLKPFQSNDKGYMIHLPDNEVLEEPKQETLEEAAENYENKDQHQRSKLDFIEGAKWQQEQMEKLKDFEVWKEWKNTGIIKSE